MSKKKYEGKQAPKWVVGWVEVEKQPRLRVPYWVYIHHLNLNQMTDGEYATLWRIREEPDELYIVTDYYMPLQYVSGGSVESHEDTPLDLVKKLGENLHEYYGLFHIHPWDGVTGFSGIDTAMMSTWLGTAPKAIFILCNKPGDHWIAYYVTRGEYGAKTMVKMKLEIDWGLPEEIRDKLKGETKEKLKTRGWFGWSRDSYSRARKPPGEELIYLSEHSCYVKKKYTQPGAKDSWRHTLKPGVNIEDVALVYCYDVGSAYDDRYILRKNAVKKDYRWVPKPAEEHAAEPEVEEATDETKKTPLVAAGRMMQKMRKDHPDWYKDYPDINQDAEPLENGSHPDSDDFVYDESLQWYHPRAECVRTEEAGWVWIGMNLQQIDVA